MKRYIVFAYYSYEGSGGWNDVLTDDTDGIVRSFDTIEEAKKAEEVATAKDRFDCSHIVDLQTGQIVG